MTTVHEVDEESLRVAAEAARESLESARKERREEHPVGHFCLFCQREFKSARIVIMRVNLIFIFVYFDFFCCCN